MSTNRPSAVNVPVRNDPFASASRRTPLAGREVEHVDHAVGRVPVVQSVALRDQCRAATVTTHLPSGETVTTSQRFSPSVGFGTALVPNFSGSKVRTSLSAGHSQTVTFGPAAATMCLPSGVKANTWNFASAGRVRGRSLAPGLGVPHPQPCRLRSRRVRPARPGWGQAHDVLSHGD